jgi:hypothetical protein
VLQFVNRDDLDFTNVSDNTPTQRFDIPIGTDVGEYTLSRVSLLITMNFSY